MKVEEKQTRKKNTLTRESRKEIEKKTHWIATVHSIASEMNISSGVFPFTHSLLLVLSVGRLLFYSSPFITFTVYAISKRRFLIYSKAKRKNVYTEKWRHIVWICAAPFRSFASVVPDLSLCVCVCIIFFFSSLHLQVSSIFRSFFRQLSNTISRESFIMKRKRKRRIKKKIEGKETEEEKRSWKKK